MIGVYVHDLSLTDACNWCITFNVLSFWLDYISHTDISYNFRLYLCQSHDKKNDGRYCSLRQYSLMDCGYVILLYIHKRALSINNTFCIGLNPGNIIWAYGEIYHDGNDEPLSIFNHRCVQYLAYRCQWLKLLIDADITARQVHKHHVAGLWPNYRWIASWVMFSAYFPLLLLYCIWIPLTLAGKIPKEVEETYTNIGLSDISRSAHLAVNSDVDNPMHTDSDNNAIA